MNDSTILIVSHNCLTIGMSNNKIRHNAWFKYYFAFIGNIVETKVDSRHRKCVLRLSQSHSKCQCLTCGRSIKKTSKGRNLPKYIKKDRKTVRPLNSRFYALMAFSSPFEHFFFHFSTPFRHSHFESACKTLAASGFIWHLQSQTYIKKENTDGNNFKQNTLRKL